METHAEPAMQIAAIYIAITLSIFMLICTPDELELIG